MFQVWKMYFSNQGMVEWIWMDVLERGGETDCYTMMANMIYCGHRNNLSARFQNQIFVNSEIFFGWRVRIVWKLNVPGLLLNEGN